LTMVIPFEFDKSRLLKAASFILDDVVDTILRNPQLTKIRIEGHTDNSGTPQYNQTLSETRAQAVLDYLIESGVPPERLEAVGYGQDQPVAANKTEAGRAKNRRVDFMIVENQDQKPPQTEDQLVPGTDNDGVNPDSAESAE